MSGNVGHAAVLVAFPVAAAIIGAVAAAVTTPGPKLSGGVQHFAAGAVFAAFAGEVLPDLRGEGNLPVVMAGSAAGITLLLALRAYSRRVETRPTRPRYPSAWSPPSASTCSSTACWSVSTPAWAPTRASSSPSP